MRWTQPIPGEELRWSDLASLLEQALVAGREPSSGVRRLDLDQVERVGDRLVFGRVDGTTPGLLPVRVGGTLPGSQAPLEARLPSRGAVDAFARSGGEDHDARLSLTLAPTEAEAPAPPLEEDRLYLGRYTTDGRPRLVARPLCARLDALRESGGDATRAWGPEWLAWTEPLHALLREWSAQAREGDPGLAALLAPLRAEWPALERSELERSLRSIARAAAERSGDEHALRLPDPGECWGPPDADGEGQVRALLAHCRLGAPVADPWRWTLGTPRIVLQGRVLGGGLEVSLASTLPAGRLVLTLDKAPRHLVVSVEGSEGTYPVQGERRTTGGWSARIDALRSALATFRRVRFTGLPALWRPSIDFRVE